MRDFDLQNRMVGPKRYGITVDDFDLNVSAGSIRFRKVTPAIRIRRQ